MKMSTNATYNTADLLISVWLNYSDIPLVGVEKIDDNKCEFCFKRTDNLEELLMVFASNQEVPCNPARLLASYKHCKSLLFNKR